MSDASTRPSLLPGAVMAVAAALYLLVIILNDWTGFLAPLGVLVPNAVRRANVVLMPLLAAGVYLRRPLSPALRAAVAIAFCFSGLLLVATARQDRLLSLLALVVTYIEVFWLLPRLTKVPRE